MIKREKNLRVQTRKEELKLQSFSGARKAGGSQAKEGCEYFFWSERNPCPHADCEENFEKR